MTTITGDTINQHYIPRFLLRGFSSCINPEEKKKRRKFYSHVGRPDGNILWLDNYDIAAEEYFYETDSHEHNATEKALSKSESNYAKTIYAILKEGRVHKSQWPKLSTLFLQLSFRTKHSLYQMSGLIEHTLSNSFDQAKAPGNKEKIINMATTKLFLDNFNRQPTSNELHKMSALLEQEYIEAMKYTTGRMRNFNGQDMVKNTTSKILLDWRTEQKNRYSGYQWTAHKVDSELILGDVCTMAFEASSNSYVPALFTSGKNTGHVLLPISHEMLLIGHDPLLTQKVYLPETIKINKNSVELSREFVVSKSREPLAASLLQLIGLRPCELGRDSE